MIYKDRFSSSGPIFTEKHSIAQYGNVYCAAFKICRNLFGPGQWILHFRCFPLIFGNVLTQRTARYPRGASERITKEF